MNQIGCHKSVGGVVQNVQCWGPLPFIKSNECKRESFQVCVWWQLLAGRPSLMRRILGFSLQALITVPVMLRVILTGIKLAFLHR